MLGLAKRMINGADVLKLRRSYLAFYRTKTRHFPIKLDVEAMCIHYFISLIMHNYVDVDTFSLRELSSTWPKRQVTFFTAMLSC